MSKGNMLLGHARGKVGSVVFSRLKGQQVTRALNPNPNNPRTASQMYQRALFADAVKFYTRGRRNLFQFAFEDKKVNESDYNAFMRENVKRGVVISKDAFDNYGYPALGNWLMSKGTIIPTGADLGTTGMIFNKTTPATTTPAVVTLGDVSKALIDGVDYLAGDILTFVTIITNNATGIPSVDGQQGVTSWEINQIQLDPTSVQPFADFGLQASTTAPDSGVSIVSINQQVDQLLQDTIAAGVVIHSRNTSSGTRVSTEELMLNAAATTALEAARERAYVDAVVESWRTTQKAPVISEAVLQGSIAQSIAADFEPAGE